MSKFKYEGGQKLWMGATGQPVTVIARTEFFTGKQPRYCVEAEEGSIQGKNMAQDWTNEDMLTDVAPEPVAPAEKQPDPRLATSKRAASIKPAETRGVESVRTGKRP